MATTTRLHHVRGSRHMFSSSDENAMMKDILATHSPDDTSFDVKPLLQIIEDIMNRAAPASSHPPIQIIEDIMNRATPASSHPLTLQGNQLELDEICSDSEMLEIMAITINKVSSEISCKCIGGGDMHASTIGIFNMLSNYEWDAKAVIALAAFAVNYGEFWLVAQLYTANPLAKSLAHLKQLPDVLKRDEALKPRFEVVTTLIKAMLDLSHCILEFKSLSNHYITSETPELATATALIPTAIYWIIHSIVACASILINITGMEHEYITWSTQAWELSSLAHKIKNIHDHLKEQLDRCNQQIMEKKQIEAYQTIPRIMDAPHLDNIKPLKHLIYLKDDQPPLYDSSTKTRVMIDVLKNKMVLLLISDVEFPMDELMVLEQIYSETKQSRTTFESQYEVVWLPVVPNHRSTWTDENQAKFEGLRNMMPWYSVFHPSLVEPAVLKYIKEVWHFNQKPMLVVMDPQGKILNTNALHMMWIWGALAFPFTSSREEALWREETWSMQFLVDSIHPVISQWIVDGRYICLYGGEDIEWIRKFTTTGRAVARAAQIQLEMMYVGKRNPREKARKIIDLIQRENLSYVLGTDLTIIWFFWQRLESMFHSKLQHGKTSDNDPILREITVMLTYDSSDQGWAVISRGSYEWMRRASGETVLASLMDYNKWQGDAREIGFLPALNDHLEANHSPDHCNRLILPGTTESVPERVVCAECGRSMERVFMYRCCTD